MSDKKESNKNLFPSFLKKLSKLLDEKKYQQIVDESKAFMVNNFLTMKEEKELKRVLQIAMTEIMENLKAVDYSKFSRQKLFHEIFKNGMVNVFAKAEFVEKYLNQGTKQELEYALEQLRNPNLIHIDIITILQLISKCFPFYDGKVKFWDKRKKKEQAKLMKDFKDAKKINGFYYTLERCLEDQLFKEPSLIEMTKGLCKDLYVDFYGFAPQHITPEQLAQEIAKDIREIINKQQGKLKN